MSEEMRTETAEVMEEIQKTVQPPAVPESDMPETLPDSAASHEDLKLLADKLDTLIRLEKRQSFSATVRMVIVGICILAFGILAIFAYREVKKVTAAVDEVRGLVRTVEEDLAAVDFEVVNKTVASLKDAAGSLGTSLKELDMPGINDTIDELKDAAGNLSKLDMHTFNDTIDGLKDAATNLSKVDMIKLNDLVASLDKVTSGLNDAVSNLKNFFSGGLFKKK